MDLYVGNTMEIYLRGNNALKDQDGNAITGATVEVTIEDRTGSEISGMTWPLVLTDDGSGEYSGELDYDLALEADTKYRVLVTASKGSTQAHWESLVTAQNRDLL